MKPLIPIFFCFLLHAGMCNGQALAQLTLPECYSLAEQNYPLVRQRDLITKTTAYTIENIQKGYWPQVTVNGQASYQSAVTEIPIKIPGVAIPTISKDQYKLYADINQTIYDGGAIKQEKELQKSGELIQQRQLASELYGLRDRVNQLFFGVLLIDEELKQASLLDSNIRLGLRKVEAAVANGTALRSHADVLKADLLKNSQHTIELNSARNTFIKMLGLFIGRNIEAGTMLIKPPPVDANIQINRPEMQWYAARDKNLVAQQRLLSIKAQPRLGLFLQAGAGRPALNFLSNNLAGYYIGGVRLTWSPSSLYTIKKERAILDLDRSNLAIQKETFLFNTNLAASQQSGELNKYRDLLASDEEIIDLRNKIKNASIAQLENGVINSSDYLREVNAEDQARQNKILHEIQWLTASYDLRTTTGN